MKLNSIQATTGSRRERKRLGCGVASGQGKTGGRGHKGQKSRTGGKIMRGFEGGQMPLIRRLPKRGFTSRNKVFFQVVNIAQLVKFDADTIIDAGILFDAGLISNAVDPVKLLAEGDLSVKLDVRVTAASKSAAAKVAAAGGSVRLAGAE
ncbi:MAG: 50S ribosomal protein L15 [Mariprofundaceae bacterium]|nr:50S ribosomal protein L15 [Mariprofundaceae bacterium]